MAFADLGWLLTTTFWGGGLATFEAMFSTRGADKQCSSPYIKEMVSKAV
jgi:hypothetical protein